MKNILLALTLSLLTIASLQAQESSWRGIPIAPEDRCAPYDRAAYPYDPSLESDIIAAMGGEICSPYNDECYESPTETDIEHIIALSEAHDSGLCAATDETKQQFASDLRNLTLAPPALQRYEKSDSDAADWLPERNRCWFAAQIVTVRLAYELTIDQHEADALAAVLANCERIDDSYPYLITYPTSVNARRCAGVTCDLVTELDSGQTIAVLNTLNSCPVTGDPRWLKVLVDDELAYIHASLAAAVDQEAPIIEHDAPPPSDSTPAPTAIPIPDAQESTTHYVFNCSGVNVRACADTSCEVVVGLPFRAAVPVIDETQGEEINGDTCWKEIVYEEESAYIHCSLLVLTQPSARQDHPPPATREPSTGLTCEEIYERYGEANFPSEHPAHSAQRDDDDDSIACER